MSAEGQAPLGEEPKGRRRAWVRGLVVGLLLLQAVIPLRYYLGDDPYDERFSWRMFSAVRVIRCNTGVQERVGDARRPRPVHLMKVIHEAWVTTLRRNREEVIRAFLARRCREEDVREVTLVSQCVDARGQRMEPMRWQRDCDSGEVEAP